MKATQKFDEVDKMHVEVGDSIIVIDGRYEIFIFLILKFNNMEY